MLGGPYVGGAIALIAFGVLLSILVLPLGIALLIGGVILLIVGLTRGRRAVE